MLDWTSSHNGYETDIPRLIHQYKLLGYYIECVVYLTNENSSQLLHTPTNFAYENNIYQIDTYRIPYRQ